MNSKTAYNLHKSELKAALQKAALKGLNALGSDAKKLEWFAGSRQEEQQKAA